MQVITLAGSLGRSHAFARGRSLPPLPPRDSETLAGDSSEFEAPPPTSKARHVPVTVAVWKVEAGGLLGFAD